MRALTVLLITVVGCSMQSAPVTTVEPPTTTAMTTTTTAGPEPDSEARSASLDRLAAELERIHPNPYWRVGSETFAVEVEDVRAGVAGMSDDQFTLEIIRLTALIDGHTVARPRDPWDLSLIHLYAFADGIYVVDAADPAMVGARVKSIDGHPIEAVWSAVRPLTSFDNSSTVDLASMNWLRSPRALAALGFTTDPGDITYTVEIDGVETDYTPDTGSLDDVRALFGGFAVGYPAVDGVWWLEDRLTGFWVEYREAEDVVFLQYNAMVTMATDRDTGASIDVETLATATGQLLDEHPGARLVVDVRHNPGGNNNTFGPVRRMVTERADDECSVAIITGRQTFSAAANFSTAIEVATPARFYGEPMGGSPNLYGDTQASSLPDVGMRLFISARYWEIGGPDDTRESIQPDVPVAVTSADFLSGRDPVLEAIVSDPVCG